jgi:hypothetical protein
MQHTRCHQRENEEHVQSMLKGSELRDLHIANVGNVVTGMKFLNQGSLRMLYL